MRDWLDAHKPQASHRTHLLLAALIWNAVGSALMMVGVRWLLQADRRHALILTALALLLGVAKSRLILDRAADRIVNRIVTRGDGKCIGGFLSVRTWMLVALMAGLGRLVRGATLPRLAVGLVYAAVGAALLLASRHIWRAWHHSPLGA